MDDTAAIVTERAATVTTETVRSHQRVADFLALADSLDQAGLAVEEFAIENCPDLPADLFSTG